MGPWVYSCTGGPVVWMRAMGVDRGCSMYGYAIWVYWGCSMGAGNGCTEAVVWVRDGGCTGAVVWVRDGCTTGAVVRVGISHATARECVGMHTRATVRFVAVSAIHIRDAPHPSS
eukprot:8126467-Pyramimonas_sp.AAC.1